MPEVIPTLIDTPVAPIERIGSNLNPSADIYRLMDEAGITLANFQQGGKSQTQRINEARVNLAEKLKTYIVQRDREMMQRGREDIKI